MPAKKNPLALNALQLKTLAILQAFAEDPDLGVRDEGSGDVTVPRMPHWHGDHIHVAGGLILGKDATGLSNPAVFRVLVRKGLARPGFPTGVAVTADGMHYDTGLKAEVVHGSDH